VNCLWLSPIFPSPDVDFGYDISDYCAINSKYGTMGDFEELLEEVHRKGLHLILDLVMNHTSDQHPWFQRAISSHKNPFHDWYLWRDPAAGGKEPNNWRSVNGGSGWEYVKEVDQYYFHMFYKQQPDLNWRNPEVQEEMLKTFRFWLDKGLDGYRLDVFNLFYKDERFTDNPSRFGLRHFDQQRHIHDLNQPEMLPLLQKIRKISNEKPDRYLVGEPFTAASPLKFMNLKRADIAAQYCSHDQLHATFCFDFLKSPWNAESFRNAIQEWEDALAGRGWPTYVLGNHDNPRPATRYADNAKDERSKAATLMLLTLRGTPFMYYGDEIGMRDIAISRSQIKDPVGTRYWPIYKGRDGCRSPMQWSAGRNSGFTQGSHTWLPVHPNYKTRNVQQQNRDADSLLTCYKRLFQLRNQYPVLVDGDLTLLKGLPSSILGYQRSSSQENALVLINFSQSKRVFSLKQLADHKWILLLSTRPTKKIKFKEQAISLNGYEAIILIKKIVSGRRSG
jgi:alpha-glucosidase